MKALILNSGVGSRMGVLTSGHPKCMTEISPTETILSRQLHMLLDAGIHDIVITTGKFDDVLMEYCEALDLPLQIRFVKNPDYEKTNYIYSIYCAREYLSDDILLMHGDLVFENEVLDRLLEQEESGMVISTTMPLPQKDFKAVVKDGCVRKVGIEFFDDAFTAQPLYKLNYGDWCKWLDEIIDFCERGARRVYAENALNEISQTCSIKPVDMRDMLCAEIDNAEDLESVSAKLKAVENRTVYMCLSTDILHGGHMRILKRAARLGKLTVGVLTDEAVASYKRYPLVPYEERAALLQNVAGVHRVVKQETLSYKANIEKYRPDIVVHGDNWAHSFQKPVREEVLELLSQYGGRLKEFPYADDPKYKVLDQRARAELALPDLRRARLKKMITEKGLVTAMEAHSGLTGLLVENTVVYENGAARQFDAMWVSSLCDSTEKGKPDIELVDMTSRLRTIDDLMEVTTKPIIFDGDTGGLKEHFVYTVRSLERMGVSMIIIEDKMGLKKNSLFGTEVKQTQSSIEDFCEKLRAGKNAQKTADFMICARIESLILEQGMEDALERAAAFVNAGADAIMIHSRKKEAEEVFEFVGRFREKDARTPLVVVPTSYNSITEEEFKRRGVNVVIYANQLMRAEVPAMKKTAETILKHHRALEADELLMPFSEIIRMIPEEA